ncbi:MAG TPA: VOC family protein [Conexibacter sp.]|jgi:catechol 2,3-dioxygenase-like lactoylglutathione lyase family enzyme
MSETVSRTSITQMSTVTVAVADQERAIGFYVGTLGLEKVADFRYGEDDRERWVEVAPPGAVTTISLVAAREGRPAGVETGVVFDNADVDGDHAALRARGVDVDPIMRQGVRVVHWAGAPLAGIPAMFLFRDPDGNSLLMVQQP